MPTIDGSLIGKNTIPADRIRNTGTGLSRDQLAQRSSQIIGIPLTDWRVWDAMQTNLPGTPATDDLGLVTGTWGSDAFTIQTEDLKAESGNPTLNRAACVVALPPDYNDGETVIIRARAGMKTTAADDDTTLDFEAYEDDGSGGVGSDLVTTAAQSINTLTAADYDFTVTASGLAAGDRLNIRMTTSVSDGATGTAVIAVIYRVSLIVDTK